jgi:hypothetical protein
MLSTGRLEAFQPYAKPSNPSFPKAERLESFVKPKGEALLPLKKGGWEGFLEELFSNR